MLINFGHNAQMQLACTKHSLIFKTEEVGTIIVDRVSSDRKLVLSLSQKNIWVFFNTARFKLFAFLMNPSIRLVVFSSV